MSKALEEYEGVILPFQVELKKQAIPVGPLLATALASSRFLGCMPYTMRAPTKIIAKCNFRLL